MDLKYQTGFQNYFQTEAYEGTLPRDKSSPQKARFGLYPEQLTGSSFTAPRPQNLRSWQYRIRPSVLHCSSSKLVRNHKLCDYYQPDNTITPPDQIRWEPFSFPTQATDFLEGLAAIVYNE